MLHVVKRNGKREEVHFDKITSRISRLAYKLDVDPSRVAQKVIQGVFAGVKTCDLDDLATEICEYLQIVLPDYGTLGARIQVEGETCAARSQALVPFPPSTKGESR
jgi:ribonucleoside-diphosphate reductase subunit M1